MWKPVHEAHAIERVRLLISFSEPLPFKALARAAEHVISDHRGWGLDTSERVSSPPEHFAIGPNVKAQVAGRDGYVFKKLDGETLVEEVGFRTGVFGYVTTTYGKWPTLESRVASFFGPAIDSVKDIVEFSDVKLEYWDAFLFDGNVEEGDARDILANPDVGIPKAGIGPGTFWHHHTGWFETKADEKFLINRNIGVAPRDVGESTSMTATIYTLVQRRSEDVEIVGDKIFSSVETMHKLSNTIFGETISEGMRNRIGLDLREYQ